MILRFKLQKLIGVQGMRHSVLSGHFVNFLFGLASERDYVEPFGVHDTDVFIPVDHKSHHTRLPSLERLMAEQNLLVLVLGCIVFSQVYHHDVVCVDIYGFIGDY